MSPALPAQTDEQAIKTAWHDQARWSKVANQLKADLFRWRYLAAVAGVLGAFLETLAASLNGLPSWWWLRVLAALIGAVVLAGVPYIVKSKVSREHVQNWVRARSASEGLKELLFRYLLGASPFYPSKSSEDFINRTDNLKSRVADLNIYAVTVESSRKEYPLRLTIEQYVSQRINDQIENYYSKKGREKALAAKRLHNIEFALGLLAVAMGALTGAAAVKPLPFLTALGPWVAVVTTASGAVTAHLAASRYDHEAIIYFGTSDRLTGLRNKWQGDPQRMKADRIAKFVDDCEHAISTENEAWLAKWTRESKNNVVTRRDS